jgi:hypothetical protein
MHVIRKHVLDSIIRHMLRGPSVLLAKETRIRFRNLRTGASGLDLLDLLILIFPIDCNHSNIIHNFCTQFYFSKPITK